MKTLWTIAFMLCATGTAIGQEDAPARTKPENPRERLAFLVGSFVTEVHILPSRVVKTESVGKGTSVITWVLDSTFLSIDERSVNSALGTYKGIGMLGFDSHEQEYVLSMYNNFGDQPQYRGTFSGDTLVLSAQIPARPKPFDQQVRWYTGGGVLHLDVLNDTGEGFLRVVRQVGRPAVESK